MFCIIPNLRKVIMRCHADGTPYEIEDGHPPAFETKAIMFTWLGFYYAFSYGEVFPCDARAEWGI